MSYKGTYDGKTLKHYRTKGSRNGYTKYPGKYNPIGEIAKGVNSIFDGAKRRQNSVTDTAPGLQVVAKTGSQLNQRTQNSAPGLKVANDVEQLNQRTQNTAPGLNVARKTPVTRQTFPRTDKTIGRRNADTNANYTSRAQEASRRAGQANVIRSNQKAAEQRRITGSGMTASQIAAKRSSQAARDAETKRQNMRTGESQVMANRRHPVSDARDIQGSANSARAAVENRRTAESKKAHYQRELEKSKKISSVRNSRSDVQNAVADAKADAKKLIKKGRKKVRNLLRKFF
jgi:hypothetical protein